MGKRLILKASAGTGKTYRLSLEYIASLIQGVDFKDILVMTFTKKATSEIKERILKFLREICENKEEKIDIEKNLKKIYGDDFSIDIDKVRKIYKNIIENKDKLKIYTIDSFTNTIFKKAIAPFLKIYSYEIIDEEENNKILIKTFEKLFENKNDFKFFKEFLEGNSEKNMKIYVDLIKEIINQRWKTILIGGELEKKEILEYKSPKSFLDKMVEIIEEISEIKGKTFQDLIKKDYQSYFIVEDKESFLTENYSLFLKDKFWNGNKTRSKKGDIDSQLEDLAYLYEDFKNNLGKKMYNELIIPYEEKFSKTIEKIYSIYDDIKFREKRFTHTDISNYTFKYLGEKEIGFITEEGLSEEFFEVIDGKLTSIFIDEFQDTSILQWRILKNILDKCENIICVGDEKQSIYGWRGGEKRLFENLSQIIEGEEEELETCYRSKENIVKYTNDIFKEISDESLDQYPHNQEWKFNSVGYRENKEKGLVKIITRDEEKEALDIMIDEIQKNFSSNYKGIGILARTKKVLENIAFALGERGIPYVLESDTSIVESRGIDGIYFLICWLVKKDFLSLLDFLRSELINMSASTLKNIIKNRENIEKYLYTDEENIEIEKEIFSVLKNLYREYKFNNGETNFLTYEILVGVGIGNRFQNEEDTLNIFGFYKLLKEYKYFNDFLIEYEENSKKDKFKKLSFESNNSISLMTIHKSKGLEFDTLFYFISSKSGRKNSDGMEFYLNMDSNYSNVKSYLLTNNKFNSILSSIEEIDYYEEKEIKSEHEEINNLYVALTRPKNNLYVVIEDIEKLNFPMLLKNKESGQLILNEKEVLLEENQIDFNLELNTPKTLYKEDILLNQKEGLNKIFSHSLQLEEKRVRGIIVHYFLENILKWEKSEIELSKRLTYAKYISLIGEKNMNELLSDKNIEYIYEKCKNIFDISWDYVYREYPIYIKIGEESKNYRLDRLMIKFPVKDNKGIIYIADYKTGKYDEEQLKNYTLAIIDKLKKSNVNLDDFEIRNEYISLDI